MEEVLNEQINVQKKPKKTFTILGISIWRIIAFFIIYSVAGYVVEVLFSIVSKGTLESRQSFMYGPFSGIYGLGAVVMILFLQYFNKNNNTITVHIRHLREKMGDSFEEPKYIKTVWGCGYKIEK